MMEETISLFDEADRLNDCKKKKLQEEASQAEEMRNMSLETFKQSQEKSQNGQPRNVEQEHQKTISLTGAFLFKFYL